MTLGIGKKRPPKKIGPTSTTSTHINTQNHGIVNKEADPHTYTANKGFDNRRNNGLCYNANRSRSMPWLPLKSKKRWTNMWKMQWRRMLY